MVFSWFTSSRRDSAKEYHHCVLQPCQDNMTKVTVMRHGCGTIPGSQTTLPIAKYVLCNESKVLCENMGGMHESTLYLAQTIQEWTVMQVGMPNLWLLRQLLLQCTCPSVVLTKFHTSHVMMWMCEHMLQLNHRVLLYIQPPL